MEADPRLMPLVGLRDRLAARAAVDPPAELAFRSGARVSPTWWPTTARRPARMDTGARRPGRLPRRQPRRRAGPDARLADVLAALDVAGWRSTLSRSPRPTHDRGGHRDLDPRRRRPGVAHGHHGRLCGGRAPPAPGPGPAVRPGAGHAGRGPRGLAGRRAPALSRRLLTGHRPPRRRGPAPEPGVLLSRFVEDWARPCAEGAGVPGDGARLPPAHRQPGHVFPGGDLPLSASQLATYVDCPLRYAYRYVPAGQGRRRLPAICSAPRARGARRFLRPRRRGRPHPRRPVGPSPSPLADDIARYRPQIEECPRDYYAMLEVWWEAEGQSRSRPAGPEGRARLRHPGGRRPPRRGHRPHRPHRRGHPHHRLQDRAGRAPARLPAPTPTSSSPSTTWRPHSTRSWPRWPTRQLQLLYVRSMRASSSPPCGPRRGHRPPGSSTPPVDIRRSEFEPSVDGGLPQLLVPPPVPHPARGPQSGS